MVSAMRDHLPIETERLLLRDFEPTDLEAFHACASDPEVTRYLPWGPNELADTGDFLRRKIAEQQAAERMVWDLAVVERESGQLLGSVALRLRDDRCHAELGYLYARHAWGRGIATEAGRAMLRFAFEHLGLHRVHATCDVENAGSARVLEKLGMRREGYFVESVCRQGRWRDSYFYAILRREWLAQSGERP